MFFEPSENTIVVPVFAGECPRGWDEARDRRCTLFLAGATIFNGHSWREEFLRKFSKEVEARNWPASVRHIFVVIPECRGWRSWGEPGAIPSFSELDPNSEGERGIVDRFYGRSRVYNQIAWEHYWIGNAAAMTLWLPFFFTQQAAGERFAEPASMHWSRARLAVSEIIGAATRNKEVMRKMHNGDFDSQLAALVPANSGVTARIEIGRYLALVNHGGPRVYIGAPAEAQGIGSARWYATEAGVQWWTLSSGSKELVCSHMISAIVSDLFSEVTTD